MKIISKISILFVLLFSAMATYSQCETYLQKANTLFTEKNYKEAKKQYQAYIACNENASDKADIIKKITECDKRAAPPPSPNSSSNPLPSISAEEWYNKGEEYTKAGNYSEAIDCYRKALERESSMSVAWSGLANAYFYQGRYGEAIDWYKKVETNNPSATIWNNIGICYQHLQNYNNAIEYYKKVERISPSVALWNNMGICYKYLKDYENAIKCFQKSGNIDNLLDLANIYQQQGNNIKAIEGYKIVVAMRPSATVWNNMGFCYFQLEEYDNAIYCFQKSNDIGNNGIAWYNMGLCYANKRELSTSKKLSKSKECFRRAAELGHEKAKEFLR